MVVTAGLGFTHCGQPDQRPDSGDIEKRIVSLDPSVTALIKAFGREAWLVGVTRHCDPIKGARIVGDMRPDLARITSVKPDIIFSGRYPYNRDALEAIQSMQLPLMHFPLLTLRDLRQAAKTIGNAVNTPKAAVAFQKRLDDAMAQAKKHRPEHAPSVLLVYGTDAGAIFTTGGGDFLSEIVTLVGGRNAAQGGPITKRLSLGQVIALSPDIILHVASDGRFAHHEAARRYWQKVGPLSAVNHKKVFVWSDKNLARMGPQIPDAIVLMAQLVRGDP